MRFGIIGTNWITDKLLDAGSQIENFELTAVYSRTEEKAREFADKYNVKNIFTDLKKMAESDLIDGVFILLRQTLSIVNRVYCFWNMGKRFYVKNLQPQILLSWKRL